MGKMGDCRRHRIGGAEWKQGAEGGREGSAGGFRAPCEKF